MQTVSAGQTLKLGDFEIEFIHVNHSIADALALCINTPVGRIIHTGDFKIDFTPLYDEITDIFQGRIDAGRKAYNSSYVERSYNACKGYCSCKSYFRYGNA